MTTKRLISPDDEDDPSTPASRRSDRSEAGTARSEAGPARSEAGSARSEAASARSEAGAARSEAGAERAAAGIARSSAAAASLALTRSLDEVIRESKALRRDVDASREQARHASRTMLTGIAVLGMGLVVLMVVAILGGRTARDARASADEARATSRLIADCTTPTGKCYADGSKRTGGAVSNIFKGQIAMTECSYLHPDNFPDWRACFDRRLAELIATPRPAPPATP